MSPITPTLHALAAASGIAHPAVLPQQNTVSFATIMPNGIAPINMAQVADPLAEAEKCNLGLYLNCKDTRAADCGLLLKHSGECTLTELIDHLIPNLPPYTNATAPISGADNANVTTITVDQTGPGANETRNATAHALVRRQFSKCPEKCAAWSAIPPFGAWFAVCVADCKVRCDRGGQCP